MKIFRKLTAAAVILAITALTACRNQQAPAQEPAAAEESAQAQETAADTAQEPAADAATEPAAAENSETLTVVAVSKSIGDLWFLSGGELAGMTEDGMDLEGISENTEVIGTVTNPSLEAIAALSSASLKRQSTSMKGRWKNAAATAELYYELQSGDNIRKINQLLTEMREPSGTSLGDLFEGFCLASA